MPITVTEGKRGFEVKITPWNRQVMEKVKAIPKSWYWSQYGLWVVPKYQERALEELKKELGVVDFDPVLDMPEQVGVLDPHPELTVDLKLKRSLLKYQEPGVAIGMQWQRFINGDDMGLGKSSSAIATAKALNCKCILVICRNTAKYNWQNEFMLTDGRKSMVLGEDTGQKWYRYHELGVVDVFIVNYQSLRKFFVKPGWKKPEVSYKMKDIPFREEVIQIFDCIIVDESHSISSESTIQSKVVRKICQGKPVVQLLTGTVLVNNVRDIAHQLLVIDQLKNIVSHIPPPLDQHFRPTDATGWTRFMNRYCNGGNGASNLNELQYRLRKICYFRRQKHEVLKDLPDKIRNVQLVDITNRAEYDQYEREFVRYLKELKNSDNPNKKQLMAGQMLVKMGALRKIAAMGKIDAAEEYVKELTDAGRKAVIFAHHTAVIGKLKAVFPKAGTLTGADKVEARNRTIKAFQEGKAMMEVVCSNEVAGESITLTASSDVISVEQPLTDAKLEQIIDRTHRIGQVNKVMACILIGRKTVDEYVYKNIILKKRDLLQAVTGDQMKNVDDEVDSMLAFFEKNKGSE